MKTNNIMELYNIKTNDVIGYIVNSSMLTSDINKVFTMGQDFTVKINEDGSYNETDVEIFCMGFVEKIYNTHKLGSIAQYAFEVTKKDFFEGIPKHYVWYRVVDKVVELRRLKLKKIYDKSGI